MTLAIRYAETDDDVISIHQFLCLVATPVLHCKVDHAKTIAEIARVTQHEVALMAVMDNNLVGTLGLVRPEWWYGSGPRSRFFTDRWFFIVPTMKGMGVGGLLLGEAAAIAATNEEMILINGHMRKRAHVHFTRPLVVMPGDPVDPQEAERYANFGDDANVFREHADELVNVDANAQCGSGSGGDVKSQLR
jgi:hypothetical protein